MNRAPIWIASACLVALFLFVAEGSARLLDRPFPGFLVWDNGTLVAFHGEHWTGARAGLPLGAGRVVEVDGRPFSGGDVLLDRAAAAELGERVVYTVEAGGERRRIAVPTMQLRVGDYLTTFGNYLFNAICLAGITLIALGLRPDSPTARALAISTGTTGLLLLLATDFFSSYRFVRLCQAVEAAVPVATYGLAIRFPFPRATVRLRRLGWVVVSAAAVGVVATQWIYFYERPAIAQRATLAVYLQMAGIVVSMLVGLAVAALRADDAADRVRAGVVLAAAVSGLMVPAFAIFVFYALGGPFSFTWVTFLLPVFPAAILFAVVRHDLFQAERFARLAVGYGATTAAIAVGYAGLLLAMQRWLVAGDLRGTLAEFLVLIGIAVSFHPIYQRVQTAIDRVFYRSELDAGRVLERMSVLLAARASEAEIVQIVEREVMSSLAVDWVSVEIGELAEPAEPAVLEEPIVYHGDMIGLLRCGPKSLGAPFSAQEADLLVGIASQTATAIHNARSVEGLREAQQALVEAERLAAIGEVAGAVAHGLRNPLAGIRAAAQMAQEIEDPDELAEALRDLIEGTDRLDGRVRRLLDFARMLEPELELVALAEVASEVRATLAAQADRDGVTIEIDVDPEIAVAADPGQLAEALIELLSNALRATGDAGRVRIEARRTAEGVELEVSDDGAGIPERVQDRVFDLFFTTRETGTGMGLATVRKMLERQGGRIELVRSSSSGTVFRLMLRSALSP